MDKLVNGWYTEFGALWPGQAMSLEVEKVLFQGKSDFQDVIIFQSKTYGKVLVLDGAIQLTERDQFSYQEMISHLPVFAHPNPKKVCVIGGGDGAVLTQLVKHKGLERIDLCDIDGVVVEQSKIHFPQFLVGFNDPRVNVYVADGVDFLNKITTPTYDVVIVDSSDPIGPAQALFEKPFYTTIFNAMTENGILCSQSECVWLHLDIIKNMQTFCKQLYNTVEYASISIPTYPCGSIGFFLCSKGETSTKPRRTIEEAFASEEQVKSLQYYNSAIHSGAFVLPEFARKALSN